MSCHRHVIFPLPPVRVYRSTIARRCAFTRLDACWQHPLPSRSRTFQHSVHKKNKGQCRKQDPLDNTWHRKMYHRTAKFFAHHTNNNTHTHPKRAGRQDQSKHTRRGKWYKATSISIHMSTHTYTEACLRTSVNRRVHLPAKCLV